MTIQLTPEIIKEALFKYEQQMPKIIDSAEMLLNLYDRDQAITRMLVHLMGDILNDVDVRMFLAIALVELAENRKYIR